MAATVSASIAMVALTVLVYLSQVNQASWLDLRLLHQSARQTQLNAQRAQLLARRDALTAEYRIGHIVSTRYHMKQASLDSALWLKVTVPARVPMARYEPAVATGPLPWISHALNALGASL